MIGCRAILAGLIVLAAATPAWAQTCPFLRDKQYVDYFDKGAFARTDFGTVGFTAGTRLIYVPKPGTACVTVPKTPLRIIFNHRGAEKTEASYVSFKLYGVRQSSLPKTRLLQRKGSWERNKIAMKADWEKRDENKPFATLISDYEAFYSGDGSASEPAFDQKFGPMHGRPQGATEFDSWDDLSAMRAIPLDLSKIAYVAHMLQRFETSAGAVDPGTPPDYKVDPLSTSLTVQTYCPMQGGKSTTIKFEYAR